ncbi:MAG: phenylacetate--CoA ligase family protein [Planctomycetes bacterium]|nr:phenylacetate--CoA ligase family protein [Planctomycetota bacterium]
MNRFLVRNVFYPLHERLRRRSTWPLLRRLRSHDAWTPGELAQARDRAFEKLIGHAAEQVPYWRAWFAVAGLRPTEIKGLQDLHRLPLMDKPFIRERLETLVADNWRGRVFQLATGGSSGEPLIFYTDRQRESSQLAAKLRCRAWWGIQPGDRQVDLWGSPIEIGTQDRFRAWKDRLLNFRMLSAFKLTDEAMAGYRDFLRADGGTDFLYGYASVLARYARFLEARSESLHDLGLRGAIATAELLVPEDREVIERVLGCPVINEYGCRDGGLIAHSCPQGSMHLLADCVEVEILSDDGKALPNGEVGEIAVTNLWSFGMPLIRYRLGDRAARLAESCDCGLPYPLLGELEGRRTDTLQTPEGNRVHGLGVMYILRVLPALREYRVIQDAPDHVEVLLVSRGEAGEDDLERPVREGLAKVLGPSMRIDTRRVEVIPALGSGKMRAVWNQLED